MDGTFEEHLADSSRLHIGEEKEAPRTEQPDSAPASVRSLPRMRARISDLETLKIRSI
jgi:hypothetical protein